MEENRSRQDPRSGAPDHGAPDDGAPDRGAPDRGAPDRGAPDHALAGEEMPEEAEGLPDHGTADDEMPDRGYELDLDQHSSNHLDAAIQDAVEAVERSGHAGEPDAGGDGEAGRPAASADQLRAELADLQERLLRTMADFDNFRKRTEREKEALRRLGASEVLKDFLSVSDNLERALESPGGVEDLKQGVRMILRQFEELLSRHGVETVESVGRPFDPTLHEAVATQQSSEVEVPTVSEEMQKGYLFHDRLLRPAMVWVTMPAAAPAEREAGGEEAEAAGEAGEAGEAEPVGEADRVVD
jgi:molecular chaperone GrpE